MPGGTVTGTLTPAPLLVTVTTPLVSLALSCPAVLAVAQAPCSASVCASVTSVIWSIGAVLVYQALYWLSMLSIRRRIVYP